MKYLITGGAGFIGSHVSDYLIEQGHRVHILDNLSTGDQENVQHLIEHDRFAITIGSILDYHTLERLVEGCDQIIHLAAAVGVKLVMEQPIETIEINVQGTANILKLASYHGKKVLIASTSEIYGKSMSGESSEHLSETDDWTLGPTTKRRWTYACSKALDEFMALAYYDEKQHPVVIIRLFNTVGPRQRGRYGMVIPSFVQSALRNEPIQVYGNGEQTRCFTYVGDAVQAAMTLMRTPEAEGQIFNVGNDEEISMNDLAERVRLLTNSRSEIVHVPYEEVFGPGFEDMQRRTPDISKLKATINFRPSHPIGSILTEIIEFYRHRNIESVPVRGYAAPVRYDHGM